jgi:hypothetical protein
LERRTRFLKEQETMSTEPSGTENGIDASEQCRRDELRAEFEGFEFRVPCEGRVLVTNVSYGSEEADEHRHVVTVENGVVWACTCPHHEHRNARCKHMRAAENRNAVLLAASVTEDDREDRR